MIVYVSMAIIVQMEKLEWLVWHAPLVLCVMEEVHLLELKVVTGELLRRLNSIRTKKVTNGYYCLQKPRQERTFFLVVHGMPASPQRSHISP
jgi:hypothetical protein